MLLLKQMPSRAEMLCSSIGQLCDSCYLQSMNTIAAAAAAADAAAAAAAAAVRFGHAGELTSP